MFQGKTITQLETTLADIKAHSLDISLPVNQLSRMTAEIVETGHSQRVTADEILAIMDTSDLGSKAQAPHESLQIRVIENESEIHHLTATPWANKQISEYTDIPREYYNRLKIENKQLLRDCINHGFAMAASAAAARRGMTGRMIRMYKGQMRALLSSRYRRLDNFDLFAAIAPSLMELGFDVESCELTDQRMYIKVVSEKVQGEVGVGDIVCYGLVISGSDVGCGSVKVEPMLYRKVCSNGAISGTAIKKAHIGNNTAGEEVERLYEDDTKRVTDAAFWMQVRDVVRNYAKPEIFQEEIQRLREAAGAPIRLFDLPVLVERTAKAVGIDLNEHLANVVVTNLGNGAHGAGMNRWGLANAFTFAGQDKTLDYEGATDLERAGGRIINLPGTAWTDINKTK